MATLEKSIEVQVPVNTAYNQWTQFEDYPQFMEDVEDPPEGTGDHIDYPAGDRPEMPGPEGVGDHIASTTGGRADVPPEGIGDQT